MPSSEDFTPPLAIGLPLVSNGGQFAAYCAPEHALLPFLSFSNRYSVWLLPLTRILPSDTLRVFTLAGLLGPVAATAATAPVAPSTRTIATAIRRFIKHPSWG